MEKDIPTFISKITRPIFVTQIISYIEDNQYSDMRRVEMTSSSINFSVAPNKLGPYINSFLTLLESGIITYLGTIPFRYTILTLHRDSCEQPDSQFRDHILIWLENAKRRFETTENIALREDIGVEAYLLRKGSYLKELEVRWKKTYLGIVSEPPYLIDAVTNKFLEERLWLTKLLFQIYAGGSHIFTSSERQVFKVEISSMTDTEIIHQSVSPHGGNDRSPTGVFCEQAIATLSKTTKQMPYDKELHLFLQILDCFYHIKTCSTVLTTYFNKLGIISTPVTSRMCEPRNIIEQLQTLSVEVQKYDETESPSLLSLPIGTMKFREKTVTRKRSASSPVPLISIPIAQNNGKRSLSPTSTGAYTSAINGALGDLYKNLTALSSALERTKQEKIDCLTDLFSSETLFPTLAFAQMKLNKLTLEELKTSVLNPLELLEEQYVTEGKDSEGWEFFPDCELKDFGDDRKVAILNSPVYLIKNLVKYYELLSITRQAILFFGTFSVIFHYKR